MRVLRKLLMANRRWRFLFFLFFWFFETCLPVLTALAVSISPSVNMFVIEKWPLSSFRSVEYQYEKQMLQPRSVFKLSFPWLLFFSSSWAWKRYIVAKRGSDDVAQNWKDMNVQDVWRIIVRVTGSPLGVICCFAVSPHKVKSSR